MMRLVERVSRLRSPASGRIAAPGPQCLGRRCAAAVWRGKRVRSPCRPSWIRVVLASPGDAQQLRQVVHNLLQNAQDATMQAGAARGRRPEPFVGISTQLSEILGARAAGDFRQWHGLSAPHPAACLRALCDHQGPGHRLGVGGGEERSPTSMAPALICPTASKTASCAARKCRYHLPQKPRWCLRHPPHNSCGLC